MMINYFKNDSFFCYRILFAMHINITCVTYLIIKKIKQTNGTYKIDSLSIIIDIAKKRPLALLLIIILKISKANIV